jgi:hypothetical protein
MQLGQDVDIVVRDKPNDYLKGHISMVVAVASFDACVHAT